VAESAAASAQGPDAGTERRLAREAFWESAKAMTSHVTLERPDGVFLLPTSIEAKLFVEESRTEFIVLERALETLSRERGPAERRTFVDVGAHIGTTSIPAVLSHGFERVVAIEPDPDALRLLHANVELNGVADRITVVEAAVAATEGEGVFKQGTRTEEVHRWMKGQLVDERVPGTVPVATVTLDGLAAAGVVDPETTDVLWFDCAGREEEALRNGESFLERRVPIVFTLRRSAVERGSSLLKLLASVYESAVDLRHPSLGGDLSAWEPKVRHVGKAKKFEIRSKLTDVLVF
jgi:FkbM family methyltransferase